MYIIMLEYKSYYNCKNSFSSATALSLISIAEQLLMCKLEDITIIHCKFCDPL